MGSWNIGLPVSQQRLAGAGELGRAAPLAPPAPELIPACDGGGLLEAVDMVLCKL